MKAYSQNVREHVVRPRAEIVQMFGISSSTLKRYIKQHREEGHMRPKAISGRPPTKRASVEAGLLPQLQAYADATLEQHLCHVGADAWGTREPVDDEARHQTAGLDTKKVDRGNRA